MLQKVPGDKYGNNGSSPGKSLNKLNASLPKWTSIGTPDLAVNGKSKSLDGQTGSALLVYFEDSR